MSVRVVARIRPLLAKELDEDVIVHASSAEPDKPATVVRIPNPRNEGEEFSFSFNGVYDQSTTQEALFTSEVAPHLKALFQGIDVTLFAYGVTGTGKTHTMRGGLKLADRGVIPRLLSGIFRRAKKLMRETEGNTMVQVALSYYEIYNDKVFDLLESHEKRPPAGLPLRAEANGKTVVVGLEERLCSDLKDFEKLYIEANNNRATAATKLNSHSSRSHAILKVKVTQTTGDEIRESTASAIDLAGSEDNRRTDNDKERLVESAAINKSLFVLSQCIDAISRGDKRIPYRESKMTRILSLGQNEGITVMILNLSPLRCSHLDTLSSLNISSRAKRIEAREIENEVVFKQGPRANPPNAAVAMMQRQPLRPLANAINVVPSANAPAKDAEVAKPIKAFNVFSDRSARPRAVSRSTITPHARTLKRRSDSGPPSRPSKQARSTGPDHASLQTPLVRVQIQQGDGSSITVSASEIEAMVERKVNEILAARHAAQGSARSSEKKSSSASDSIKRRLKALERRIENEEGRDDSRSEGLRYLLAARQAKEKGDEAAALSAYEKALPYFPDQPRLVGKIEKLQARLGIAGEKSPGRTGDSNSAGVKAEKRRGRRMTAHEDEETEVHDDTFAFLARSTGRTKSRTKPGSKTRDRARSESKSKSRSRSRSRTAIALEEGPKTPRTRHLLDVINSGNTVEIKKLAGFGAKKAHDLAKHVELLHAGGGAGIESLSQLRTVPGLGGKSVDRAYAGLCPAA